MENTVVSELQEENAYLLEELATANETMRELEREIQGLKDELSWWDGR